jgi:Fe-S cluster assembly protein SufB
MPHNETVAGLGLEEYKYDFKDESKPVFKAQRGLSEEVVRQISAHKGEPQWMLDFRLKALKVYYSKPMPTWGGDLTKLDATLDEIYFYLKPQEQMERSWDDVPDDIKRTFERLGIPEAERKVLAGSARNTSRNGLSLAEKGVGGQGHHLRIDRGWAAQVSGSLPRALLHHHSAAGQ